MDLNQITIPCADYYESVAFYRTLGLTQIVDSPPRYARFESSYGSTLSLHLAEAAAEKSGVVIYFEVPDVDACVAELKKAGLRFDSDPVDQTWLWREAYLSDPAGNRVCLFYGGENRRNPPWRI